MWPAALGAQHGQRRLGDVNDAEQVGVDLGAEVIRGDVLDRAEVGVARVVDDDVDPAECLCSRGDRRLGGGGVGDVERERQDLAAVAVGQVGQARGLAGGGDEPVPGRERGLGDLTAKAAALPVRKKTCDMTALLRSEHLIDNVGLIITQRRCVRYTGAIMTRRDLSASQASRAEARAPGGDPRRRPRLALRRRRAFREPRRHRRRVGIHKSALLRYFETREQIFLELTAKGLAGSGPQALHGGTRSRSRPG